MLVLSRRKNQKIVVNNDITITVVRIKEGVVRLRTCRRCWTSKGRTMPTCRTNITMPVGGEPTTVSLAVEFEVEPADPSVGICAAFLHTRRTVDPLTCSRELRDAMRKHARECESCRAVMDPDAPSKLNRDELVAVVAVMTADDRGGD